MAAWLTWLKSRLLVPALGEPEDAEAAAEMLALRLIDLQVVRAAAVWMGTAPAGRMGCVSSRDSGGTHRDRPEPVEGGDERAAQRLSGGAAAGGGEIAIPAEADGVFLGAERAGAAGSGWSARSRTGRRWKAFLPEGLADGLPRRAAHICHAGGGAGNGQGWAGKLAPGPEVRANSTCAVKLRASVAMSETLNSGDPFGRSGDFRGDAAGDAAHAQPICCLMMRMWMR